MKKSDGWHCRICGSKIYAARDDEGLCGWCRLTRAKARQK